MYKVLFYSKLYLLLVKHTSCIPYTRIHRVFNFIIIFPRFRGVHHAFTKILAEGGIRGLWAGWVPNIQRAALVNMGGNGNFIEF
jgi:hypothetical protein